MAQLTDDCFAFSGPLLRLEDMNRLIAERISPVTETEFVPLGGARGRVTAVELKAPLGLPPFDSTLTLHTRQLTLRRAGMCVEERTAHVLVSP